MNGSIIKAKTRIEESTTKESTVSKIKYRQCLSVMRISKQHFLSSKSLKTA